MFSKGWDDYTELEQAAITYSDYFKSVHGFRPHMQEWTLADFEEAFASLEREGERMMALELEMMQEAIDDFEGSVEGALTLGAADRETAVRWVLAGELDEYDMERGVNEGDAHYVSYVLGLPFAYNWQDGKFNKGELNPITRKVEL